ncbi:MAG: HD domain-containing protein [Candidatus Altiarchaeota archaeon]|nr:HD domain-containing protein [Candidatus Altiarchaeota archaeon]
MKASKVIRDPIHGNITLGDLELCLIDTPEMQRLRHIRQNGLCYLVYPAMNSTRFEHSLGVMHLARVVSQRLGLGEKMQLLLQAAGLLHDVGHGPFSHLLDKMTCNASLSHERLSSRIILHTPVADILRDFGLRPKDVSSLVLGHGMLSRIISSEIDVDKMDYLKRDSYYAGVAYGVIDVERLVYAMALANKELVISEGNVEVVESLLINRNLMYQTVYRHRTKRIAESMMLHAVRQLVGDKVVSLSKLVMLDDVGLISLLRSSSGYTRDMMESIDRRRLFKAFCTVNIASLRRDYRERLAGEEEYVERRIAADYGISESELFVDAPEPGFSEFRVRIEHEGSLKRIDQLSALARALEKSEQEKLTVGLYTHPRHLRKLANFKPEKYFKYAG